MKDVRLIIAAVFAVFVSSVSAEEPRYLLKAMSGILEELGGDENEKPFKAWMKEHRPERYSKMFEKDEDEEAEDESEEKGEKKGLFSAVAEISKALAEPRIALLDYYVNKKAEEGWRVVSMGEGMILFEKRQVRRRGEARPGGE